MSEWQIQGMNMVGFYKDSPSFIPMVGENNLKIKTLQFLGGSITMLLEVQAVLVFVLA